MKKSAHFSHYQLHDNSYVIYLSLGSTIKNILDPPFISIFFFFCYIHFSSFLFAFFFIFFYQNVPSSYQYTSLLYSRVLITAVFRKSVFLFITICYSMCTKKNIYINYKNRALFIVSRRTSIYSNY